MKKLSIPLGLFILLIFFLWRGLSLEPQKLPYARLDKPLPAFTLSVLDSPQNVTEKVFQGNVSLLNVWASWCEACADEQVFLLRLARESIPIYGLNYKDNPTTAKRWLSEWGNPYKLIGEDPEGKFAFDLGVYGTPETFLIDKKGIIRYRHVGILDETIWRNNFLPLIKQWQEE